MATAENELIYVVRINTEGDTELVQVGKTLNKNDDSFKQTEKSVKKYRSSLKDLATQQAKNGGSTASFNKRNSSASNLLIELSRGASDAQYGIRGLGNNLEQAAYIGSNAYKHFGSLGGLLKGIGASMLGPTGIVVGITAITTGLGLASAGVFDFGKKTKDFASDSEEMIAKLRQINSELVKLKGLDSDSFFSTEGDLDSLRRLNLIEEDVKDQIRDLERIKSTATEDVEFISFILQSNPEEIRKRFSDEMRWTNEYVEFIKKEAGTFRNSAGPWLFRSYSDEAKDQMKQLETDLEAVGEEISTLDEKIKRSDRLKSLPEGLAAEWERAVLNAEKYNKETDDLIKKLDQDIADLDTDLPEHEADPNGESEAIQKRKEQQLQEQGRARLQFEKTIDKMRLASLRASGNEHVLLAAEEQQKIDEVKNNELLTARQRKEALQLIEEEYSNKRINLAKKEAEEKERLEQQLLDAKLNFATTLTGSLTGFGEVIAGSSEKNAKQRFEIDKALNYASAITNTAAAVTQALKSPLPPPGPQIQAAAIGAAGAVQIAKIAATKFQASGSSAAAGSVGYRGFDTSAPAFSNPEPSSRSRSNDDRQASERSNGKEFREIRITDGFGKMVALGQEEIDASGGSDYLRGGL